MSVTLYAGNRLDQAREYNPAQLVVQFVDAVRSGYFTEPCGGGIQWAFRLWLTDPNGANSTWDPADEAQLFNALDEAIQGSDETRALLADATWGDA
jgi:hypothetical protein